MNKNFVFLIVLSTLLIISACQSTEKNISNVQEKDLEIAIIGEIPDITEENIKFTGIDFKELENESFYYDAVFIMENYLGEATQINNIKRFKNSSKPIFFIGSKASYFPFIESENPLPYQEYVERLNISNYEVSGIIYVDDITGYRSFNISSPVEEVDLSSSMKKKVFSEVFNAIRKNKLHKEDSISN